MSQYAPSIIEAIGAVVVAVLALGGVIVSGNRSMRSHFDDKLSNLDDKLDGIEERNHEEHMRNLGRISEIQLAVGRVDSKIDQHIAYHKGTESNHGT